jgi:sugar (pentulose or hexulose) kinase
MKKAILVFDIGKTNKKFLLFGENYEVLLEEEIKFPEIADDEGFPCDDIAKIEAWMSDVIGRLLNNPAYEIKAINFSTYGASLAFLDEQGKRCAPVYNYLKPMPDEIKYRFVNNFNSDGDFFRRTASPDLGLLNSGLQIYWLKNRKPDLYEKVKSIMHFPQYVAYLLSGKITSEHTSLGCHTAMWDFDNSTYHPWLKSEEINLPVPVPNDTMYETILSGKKINVGIGIHDSSASLVPYLKTGDEFILISSGTWCINMNPFNPEPLTKEELDKDCLCYLSTKQKQVKSSRLFMGHYHDTNLKYIEEHYKAAPGSFKKVKPDSGKLLVWSKEKKRIFFNSPLTEDGIDHSVDLNMFSGFDEAYNRFMFDLTMMEIESVNLVVPKEDNSKNIYISGGFSNNEIFVGLIACFFKDKNVYVSEISNSSALGAAMALGIFSADTDLGLKKIDPLF